MSEYEKSNDMVERERYRELHLEVAARIPAEQYNKLEQLRREVK